MSTDFSKVQLERLYVTDKLSSKEIATKFNCSENKINYWMRKYQIPKRTIADAVYQKLNPHGNPFKETSIDSLSDAFLLGLGTGLFWGEGNKRDKNTVRLGNSDPDLMRAFLFFLENRFQISRHRLRFGLQVFSDMDYKRTEKFWIDKLSLESTQFYKTVITVSGKIGTYTQKTEYGVLTIYFHNKKLRDLIVGQIDNLRKIDYHSDVLLIEEKADVAQG
ncbi:MAG: hypothetical protein V4644_01215 [Patescibacteria group bacterium]